MNPVFRPCLEKLWLALAVPMLLIGSGIVSAQPSSPSKLWPRTEILLNRPAAEARVKPKAFHAFNLNPMALRQILERAPLEFSPDSESPQEIQLPMPDGSFARFRCVESPVMSPELAAKFPEIKTYRGQGMDDPAASVRFDLTPQGFHAQILSPNGAVYIEPYWRGDATLHVSFFKRDLARPADGFQCLAPMPDNVVTPRSSATPDLLRSGNTLRTYRLACAATGEYVQYHGGTVSAGMSAIVTAINRVDGVYEQELSIRMILVANNNLVVYTNANTDPYNNSSGSTMLSQNQSNLDSVIGSANYDIGHVFSTGGGGIATLGCVCVSGAKARGVTGSPAPVSDAFYIDYVAHEMGHQFGANHTFNSVTGNCGGGNRNASTAYEPGSGTTIMAYAGICGGDDLQPHSDPYFHFISFDEILAFITSGSGSSCAVATSTGNTAPTVSVGANHSIPRSTPFTLTASGSDPNGDVLTYCWEERDLGASQTLTDADNGSSPLFRSFNPTLSASRIIPKLDSLLNNTVSLGEKLPATTRTMNFRVTARDNRTGGGGVNTADMQVNVVSSAGPFIVTSPNSAVSWSGAQTVTWNVAGTTASPINAATVNILLSTNGGVDFPIILATNTPNDGLEFVVLPNLFTSAARVKVEANQNIFFDISDANFSVSPGIPFPLVILEGVNLTTENCAVSNNAIDPGETVTVHFQLRNVGTADTTNLVATLLATNGIVSPGAPQNYGVLVAGGPAVSRAFTFSATGVCGGTNVPALQLQDGASGMGTLSTTFNLGARTAVTNVASNATPIEVPAMGNKGNGAPYPSVISISGASGTVEKVRVTLNNFGHTYPDDVDVLLVGPGGQSVLLMSDAGGGLGLSGATLTFEDDAAASLPDATQIVSGSYRPSNFDTSTDAFSSPAPAGSYGAALSVFNGLTANGAWSLYAVDDSSQDAGDINGGWTLTVITSSNACCVSSGGADLAVNLSASTNAVNMGDTLQYFLSLTNRGPGSAAAVRITNSVPGGWNVANVTVSAGTFQNQGSNVVFDVGTLNNGAAATMTLTLNAGVSGTFTNTAIASSTTSDPNLSDNSATVVTLVNARPTISNINSAGADEDTPSAPVAFMVSDMETPPDSLSVFVISSDTNLIAPGGLLLGGSGTNRMLVATPRTNQSGITLISIFVNDGMATVTNSFLFTVNSVNDAPELAAVATQFLTEGETLAITNVASDVDGDLLTFALETNAPVGAYINATNGVFSWTPSEAQGPSTNVITVRVSDNGSPSLSLTQNFSVVVSEINQAPDMVAISDFIVDELTALTFTNVASDVDMPPNQLSYSLGPGAPTNAFVNPTTGVFSWTPTEAQGPGTNVIVIRVTDNGSPSLSATQAFSVIVNEINQAPSLAGISNRIVYAGGTISVTNSATDSDLPLQTLTFALENDLPVGATMDSVTGVFTWTPSELQLGTNLVSVRVTDDGSPVMSATNQFYIVVTARPVIDAIHVFDGDVVIRWSAVGGAWYRLQSADTVDATNWVDWLPDILADGEDAAVTNSFENVPQRFFRLRVLP